MLNPDILSKADKVLRPVLKELARLPWMRLESCCAGHKMEDNLWIEVNVLGASGLRRLSAFLRVLDLKLADTEIGIDCMLSYQADSKDEDIVPHGWIPAAIEISWVANATWRRSQAMVIEAMLSSIADFNTRPDEGANPPCAINYCPFCSSSLIRIDTIEKSGAHRYRCGDCDVTWTMMDPVI